MTHTWPACLFSAPMTWLQVPLPAVPSTVPAPVPAVPPPLADAWAMMDTYIYRLCGFAMDEIGWVIYGLIKYMGNMMLFSDLCI